MNVIDLMFFWARIDPHRAAIIQPEMVTTFQGLADAIESVSDRIDRLGLDLREPIAVSLANPSHFVAAALAVLRCGYTLALVNPPLFPQLQPSGIRNLIYDTQGLVLSGGRNIRFEMSWLPASPPSKRKPYRPRPLNDVSTIAFTSGTTGLPKMQVLRRAALEHRFACPITSLANGDHQKALIMPGVAGGFGFNRTCEMLFAGKTACFAPSAEEALWLISTFGIDCILASPQQALGLAEIQQRKTRYALESVKTLRIGGAAVPPEMARRLRSHVCRNVIIYYASTEAGTAASAPYDAIEGIPHAVGFVGPDVELEIVDEADSVLPVGSEGLIRLRTLQSRLNSDPSKPVAAPGSKASWFYPGDIGRLTEDGILCVSGRSADVINSGGVKVSAAKIEEIVQALPEVREAAACGIVGPSGIEELWVAVIAVGQIDPEAIKRLLKENEQVGLAPAQIVLVEKLPRGDLGKLQRHRLKEQLLGLKKRG
ncbi:MAG TPA: class I adenylate-forming enzyme family protein [Xanthobacteraceae bacterium]|jgi:acyl-coenzyme A synthetase/AMP-(fatty) acid ligase|nr:class I adenylate-forming enzyme family protein [Xanthobacteraceae bacterium]